MAHTISMAAGGTATFILLWELGRRLPLQNLLVIALVTAVAEGLLEWFLSSQLWSALWRVAVLLAARRLAQLLLGPWRNTSNYGIWLILLAASMTAWPSAIVWRFFSSAAILVALVPWFIQKRPVTISAATTGQTSITNSTEDTSPAENKS